MKVIRDLPEIFEEFGEQRKKSFLDIKEQKDKGIPVVGVYCAYFPTELAMAAGAIPVGLCSFSNETVAAAERDLPKSMCPLIKSSYGFAIEDKCPFYHFSDLVIGETTCDGKKKMYELMAEFKAVFVMELPNSQSEESIQFWRKEVIRTKEYFEEFFNVVISDEKLIEATKLQNRIRKALKDLCEVMKLEPAPVLGLDIYKMVNGSKFRFDFQNTPEIVNAVTDKILEEYKTGKCLEKRARILLTGCPVGGDSLKVIKAIEDNGGVVVAIENCSGVKAFDKEVEEDTPDIYEAIARRYIEIGCSIMTPNDNRIDLLGSIIDDYQVDGVVEMVLSGCHSTGVESLYIRKFVTDEKKLPYLSLETEYSQADYGQIETRIAALMEMIAMDKMDGEKIDINHCYKILFSNLTKAEPIDAALYKLWKYTGMSFTILNKKEEVLVSSGDMADGDWRNYKYKVEEVSEDEEIKVVGGLPFPQMKSKGHELLKMVGKSYTLKMGKKTEDSTSEKSKNVPDYLWILVEQGNENKIIQNAISTDYKICAVQEDNQKIGYLISGIQGRADRGKLIESCKKYTQEYEVSIWLGNGFREIEKATANRQVMERIMKIGQQSAPRKKVYLMEEFYQELAVDFVTDHLGEENSQLKELGIIRKEDKKEGTNLYETLYWYLMMNRNILQTAARLKIHRNTLVPRIARINELLRLDEIDGVECERILIAMQLEKAYQKKYNE